MLFWPILLVIITILGLIALNIFLWNDARSWIKCLKCEFPIKTIKNKKICKSCKKEGFRIKKEKQLIFESWFRNIKEQEVENYYQTKNKKIKAKEDLNKLKTNPKELERDKKNGNK